MMGLKRAVQCVFWIGLLVFAQLEFGVQFKRASDGLKQQNPKFFAKKDPVLLKVLSFGHLPALIDWLWIQSIAESSAFKMVLGQGGSPFFMDLDVLTDLDPAFYSVYLSGGLYLTVVRDENESARDLLVKATHFAEAQMSQFPEDFQQRFWGRRFEIWIALAYIYLFELNDFSAAYDAYRKAAEISGSPVYLKFLVKKLSTRHGQAEVGLRVIDFVDQQMDAQMKPEKKLRLSILRQRLKAMMESGQGSSP